jgi:hypothetical protein
MLYLDLKPNKTLNLGVELDNILNFYGFNRDGWLSL